MKKNKSFIIITTILILLLSIAGVSLNRSGIFGASSSISSATSFSYGNWTHWKFGVSDLTAVCCEPNNNSIATKGVSVTLEKQSSSSIISKIAYLGSTRYSGDEALILTGFAVGEERGNSHIGANQIMQNKITGLRNDAKNITVPSNFEVYIIFPSGGRQEIVGWRFSPDGYLKINKTSSDTSITNNNGCYGKLSDAVFGVYSDSALTKKIATIKPNGKWTKITAGTYYINEDVVPKGFKKMAKKTVTIDGGESKTVSFENTPLMDPVMVLLYKQTKSGETVGLGGAEYTVKYYAASSAAGSPLKTWVIKTDSDGVALMDDAYKVSGPAFFTNEKGRVSFPYGTVTIQETKAPAGFAINPEVKTFNIDADSQNIFTQSNAPISIEEKNGALGIKKVSENNTPLAGVEFAVYSDEQCSMLLGEATTNTNGEAIFGYDAAKDEYSLTPDKTYYVKETNTSVKCVLNETIYPVKIVSGKVTYINNEEPIVNYYKRWTIELVKKDSESGITPQGDAVLSGAKFGLYNQNDELVKTYVTGKNGKFKTDEYLACEGWYFKELEAPEGYLLNDTKIVLSEFTKAENLTKRITNKSVDFTNEVKKGTVSLVKTTPSLENPDKLLPEEGAAFEIYLKSDTTKTVLDSGVVDETGALIWKNTGTNKSRELPYGTYTIHQTKAWEGRLLADDFDVDIHVNNKNYPFAIENPIISAKLSVLKVDSETNKPIVASKAAFKIKNLKTNSFVTHGPLDVFKTDESGEMKLPGKLPYGKYELIEVEAPNNYFKENKSIQFEIKDAAIKEIKITAKNTPLKGKIELEKLGIQFTDVKKETNDFGEMFTPIFSEKYLAGCVFDIFAAEDIKTGDGEIKYKKDEKVDTVITGSEKVQSKELYVGKYYLVETKTVAGYKLDSEKHYVDVTNDGTTLVSIVPQILKNDRISTSIVGTKMAETWNVLSDEDVIGREKAEESGEDFVFGLYAAEKISGLNSVEIPEGSLVAVSTSDETGKFKFDKDLPFGKYYVKELKTSDKHSYIIDNTEYPIDLTTDKTDGAPLNVFINDSKVILNKIKTFPVTITKKDITTKDPVSGALVTIRDSSGEILYAQYTKEDGTLPEIMLEPGEYTFSEKTAPAGYLINTNTFNFKVNEDGTIDGVTVIEDEPIPEIKTTAAFENGNKEAIAKEMKKVIDKVEIKKLVVGKEYTVKGTLVNKDDPKQIIASGETTFTAEKPEMTVDVEFVFDASKLEGKTIVVFEDLYRDNERVATHSELQDKDQTAYIPKIRTKVSETEVRPENEVKLKDVLFYENLTVGQEYKVIGTLMDQESKKPLLVNDKEVTAETIFTPSKKDGKVSVTFTFDASSLDGHTVVVFEEVTNTSTNEVIGEHKDFTDKDQTFKITPQPKTGDYTNALKYTLMLTGAVLALMLLVATNKKK